MVVQRAVPYHNMECQFKAGEGPKLAGDQHREDGGNCIKDNDGRKRTKEGEN